MARTLFQPGVSGNPGGKAKLPEGFLAACRLQSEEALRTVVDIMTDKRVKAETRLKAAEVILNRAWGMPVQQVLQDTTIRKAPVALFPADMSPDELENVIPKLLERSVEPVSSDMTTSDMTTSDMTTSDMTTSDMTTSD